MKVERNRAGNKYTLTPEDKEDEKLLDRIAQLEEENKKLKERVSELEDVSKDYDLLSKDFIALGEENKKLSEKIGQLKSDLAFKRTMLDNVRAEYKSSQNVIKELKEELEHYKNTEAIQKSNAASRYKYPSTSYVDRELNSF